MCGKACSCTQRCSSVKDVPAVRVVFVDEKGMERYADTGQPVKKADR